MNSQILSEELRRLVESRIVSTIDGIEETLLRVLEDQRVNLEDLKEAVRSLEESFEMFSQKWSLQILYALFLRRALGFNQLREILGVNSRALSDKLKRLERWGYIARKVNQVPPVRVRYSLTTSGRNTILLALPLLYYSSRTQQAPADQHG